MKNTITIITSIFVLSFWGCEEPDTTSPEISISNPTNGASVRDTVTIETEVSDNEGISSVEFYLDDSLIGNTNVDPYQLEWNTNEASIGEHSLYCKAIDNSDNETQSESIQVNVANPYPLPSEFPLFDNTGWIYKIQAYNSATEYLLDLNPEILLDTLYIFSSSDDYFLYSWRPTEYFSLVKNYDNKLLNIGEINLVSDTLYFYEKPVVWAVYDDVFDTTIISQYYELNGIFNRYEVEDSLFNHTYSSYVLEREYTGLGHISEYISIEGFSKQEVFWDGIGWYFRVYMIQKFESVNLNRSTIGFGGIKSIKNKKSTLRQLSISPKTLNSIIE